MILRAPKAELNVPDLFSDLATFMLIIAILLLKAKYFTSHLHKTHFWCNNIISAIKRESWGNFGEIKNAKILCSAADISMRIISCHLFIFKSICVSHKDASSFHAAKRRLFACFNDDVCCVTSFHQVALEFRRIHIFLLFNAALFKAHSFFAKSSSAYYYIPICRLFHFRDYFS